MNQLQPLKLLPMRERIASVLRKAILTREIQEGTIVTLDGVASQLEVSNTPVREAFQILARDGFIKLRHNKGAEVLGITKKFIKDHYVTRAVLEREAVAEVCQNKADLSEIIDAYQCGKNAIENDNYVDYTNYNQAFHMAIWAACGNNKINSILSEMWNGLSLGSNISEQEYAILSSKEHGNILNAMIEYNAELAKNLMYQHIIRSMEDMLTRF